MAADHALLKEVALELWNTTKKLRPGLPKAPRAQLVLKALMIIGDVGDQLETAMVLGLIAEQEPDDDQILLKMGKTNRRTGSDGQQPYYTAGGA